MSQRAKTRRNDARWAKGKGAGKPASFRPTGRWRWSRRCGLLALIGLLLLALSSVQQHRRRQAHQQQQQAAQHSAELTAGWVARTLNTVAFNNRCMAQMIVQVNVLDSLPTAIADSLTDQKTLAQRLTQWRQQASMLPWTASALEAMGNQIDSEIALLTSLQNALLSGNDPDIQRMTLCRTDEGTGARTMQEGRIWQAMRLLQQQSIAMLENLSLLAASQAAWPQASPNGRSDDGLSLVRVHAPDQPSPLWRVGHFDDFGLAVMQAPMKSSETMSPRWTGGHAIARSRASSPFPARSPQTQEEGDGSHFFSPAVLADPSSLGLLKGHCPLSLPVGIEPSLVYPPLVKAGLEGETKMGLQGLILDRLNDQIAERLPMSRMARHLQAQAVPKIGGLWPDKAWPVASVPPSISPDWVTSMQEARRRAALGETAVETLFAAVEVRSRWPLNDPHLGEPGSWNDAYPTCGAIRLIRLSGWVDPANWPASLKQVAPGQWRDVWSYPVHQDQSLDFPARWDQAGHPVVHTVHRIDDFFFIAADFGKARIVSQPYNLADHRQLPGPVHWLAADPIDATVLSSAKANNPWGFLLPNAPEAPEQGTGSAQAFRLLTETGQTHTNPLTAIWSVQPVNRQRSANATSSSSGQPPRGTNP